MPVVVSYSQTPVTVVESERIQEFEELLALYNKAFYDRDLTALRALYVPDVEVPYFDNHADCDSPISIRTSRRSRHSSRRVTSCLCWSRTFGPSSMAMPRAWSPRSATLRNRYLEFGHRSSWSGMRRHGGFAISTFRRIQLKQAHNTSIEFARYAGRTASPQRGLSAAEPGRHVAFIQLTDSRHAVVIGIMK